MLTVNEVSQIESVLKVGLYLIYGPTYVSYNWALKQAKMCNLQEQRNKIFNKFTKKCLKSDKFTKWFSINDHTNTANTRSIKQKYKSVPVRTLTYEKSPIPQMTILANSYI